MPRKVSRRVARIWNRLGQWYGARWADSYGSVPPDDWADLIDRTDDERIEHALAEARRTSPIHPMTLGQLESAIPKKRRADDPSPAKVLCDFVLAQRRPCIHQTQRTWTYFSGANGIAGVVVPGCLECNSPSLRVKLEEITGEGIRAA